MSRNDSVAVLRELRAAVARFPDAPNRKAEVAALDAAITALSAQGEECEAVAFQYRDRDPNDAMGKKWWLCSRGMYDGREQLEGRYMFRALYLHPAPPGSDAVTEEMPPLPIAQWGYGLGNQCHYYTEDQMLAYGRLCKAAMVSKHWGYVVGGTSFYYPDFPRSEWPNHASVVAVFSDGVNLAALAARTGKGEANGSR